MTETSQAPKWRQRAACRGQNTDQFYRSKEALRPPPEIQRICDGCPVRGDCLLWAIERREQGIWGGTTEVQRRVLRRHYLRARCPSCGGNIVPTFEETQVCIACGLTWLATKLRTRDGVITVKGSGGGVESVTK
jgi:WhiB family redox-sensing transcriptional regulator